MPVVKPGAQVEQVDEPRTLFIFELEAYPEPKSLSSTDLKELHDSFKNFKKVADHIGASEAFVRQNCQKKKYKNSKKNKQKGEI